MSENNGAVKRKPLKTRGTLYTPEMISAARSNEIISAVKNDDNTFTLDIGDITLIKKYSDEKNDCSLYDYNLSENQTFTIAQTFSDPSENFPLN